jgi:hypothetical protein
MFNGVAIIWAESSLTRVETWSGQCLKSLYPYLENYRDLTLCQIICTYITHAPTYVFLQSDPGVFFIGLLAIRKRGTPDSEQIPQTGFC